MSPNRGVILLLDVIGSIERHVWHHNHRRDIYRPIIDSFEREGLDRRIMMGRCGGRDPAFDEALRAGPLQPVDPRKMR